MPKVLKLRHRVRIDISLLLLSINGGRPTDQLMWTVPLDRAPFTGMPLVLATGMDTSDEESASAS